MLWPAPVNAENFSSNVGTCCRPPTTHPLLRRKLDGADSSGGDTDGHGGDGAGSCGGDTDAHDWGDADAHDCEEAGGGHDWSDAEGHGGGGDPHGEKGARGMSWYNTICHEREEQMSAFCYGCERQVLNLGQPSNARWVGPDGKAYCSMHFIQRFGHGEKLVRVEGYQPPEHWAALAREEVEV